MKTTLAISIDEELDRRVRLKAEELNQPVSWYVRKILEREVWPEKSEQSGASPAIVDPAEAKAAP